MYLNLTLLHSERQKMYKIWAFLSAVGLNNIEKLYHSPKKSINIKVFTFNKKKMLEKNC